MSVTSDLARLSLTIDRANELLLSDQIKTMDVGGGVMRDTNAKVLADLATQMSGALIYTSVALGLAGTISGAYFSVLSLDSSEYVVLYQNSAGSAIEKKRYPSAEVIKAMRDVIQQFSSLGGDRDVFSVTDGEGALLAGLTERRVTVPYLDISSAPGASQIGDEEGAVDFYSDSDRTIVGPLEVQYTQQGGVFLTDQEGAELPAAPAADASAILPPFTDGLMFSPVIATSDLRESRLYVENILSHRELVDGVVGSISSTTTSTVQSGHVLPVSASKLGSTATLAIRTKANPNNRRIMSVAMKHVPVQSPVINKTVLFIGDSIGNRQGVQFLKQYLAELGINATFIGTLETSNSSSNANDITGPLAESREGWETGDFTYAVTDRVSAVAVGGEAAYLAMSKTDRWLKNPFLRVATGADAADIICNGYVFDPAFYASRFSLPAPDIVINMLGTNDVRDRTAVTIGPAVLSNDTIMHKQIRAAWPSAKIIRSFPGTSLTADRNALWASHYRPLALAIRQSAAALSYSGLTVAPIWAMTDPENGYAFSAATPGDDGFIDGSWSDDIHPTGSSRHSLAVVIAQFVAAAALNLI